ncbi:hypothetical protein SAMN02745165_02421 [Malonomonas rubra DSM 5091]|uniref:Uncharacterized protein n=1 Tax=Malonomonas rubra DSM 5091 TaxID=1122189 RepID=A0A1M6JET7_MALRU|nr:hypothetical protein [Malonomonas rubra]SHJ45184.1 hypothetical protein SAMN02745165_02421 [Malonomonas rubra DSM 5091]
MKNKLIRLVELIQDGFSDDLLEAFRTGGDESLETRLSLLAEARSFHQNRSENLWLEAGKKRTPEEKQAAAQAELAAFLSAYLSGDAKEHLDSGVDALETLGRYAEVDLVRRLAKC